jgi:hypothetical protein
MDLHTTGTRLVFAVDLEPGDRVVDCPFVTVASTLTIHPASATEIAKVVIRYEESPIPVTVEACAMFDVMVPEGYEPLTREEHAGIIRRARGTLARALEPLDEWLARRQEEDERRHCRLLALDALYAETPWWQLRVRHWLRQEMAKLTETGRWAR